jgi:hypothetical protein
MSMKNLYLALCLLGMIIPNVVLMPWLFEHGLDVSRFFAELFVNRISSVFGLDVMLSILVLAAFSFHERTKTRFQLWWVPIVGALLAGVCFGFPLLLYLREPTES